MLPDIKFDANFYDIENLTLSKDRIPSGKPSRPAIFSAKSITVRSVSVPPMLGMGLQIIKGDQSASRPGSCTVRGAYLSSRGLNTSGVLPRFTEGIRTAAFQRSFSDPCRPLGLDQAPAAGSPPSVRGFLMQFFYIMLSAIIENKK